MIVATALPLARIGSRPYLRGRRLHSDRHLFGSNARLGQSTGVSAKGLAQPVSTPHLPAGRSGVRPVAIAGGVLAAAVLLATLALWSHYGTAVFFEMIATGFAACF